MKNVGFNYRGKKFNLDCVECNSLFMKGRGLMFRRREKAPAMIFNFDKEVDLKIHSFFCCPFIAVWLDSKNKVLEIKKIIPWVSSVKPKKSFKTLIEIPLNRNYSEITKELVGK